MKFTDPESFLPRAGSFLDTKSSIKSPTYTEKKSSPDHDGSSEANNLKLT